MSDIVYITNKNDLLVLVIKQGNHIHELIQLIQHNIVFLTDAGITTRAYRRDFLNNKLKDSGNPLRMCISVKMVHERLSRQFSIEIIDNKGNDMFTLIDIEKLVELE